MENILSPFNYVGSKAQLLLELQKTFGIDYHCRKFVDLFAGSFTVGANQLYRSESVLTNDLCEPLVEAYQMLANTGYDVVKGQISSRVDEFDLNNTSRKIGKRNFYRFRKFYNDNPMNRNPSDTLILARRCYNGLVNFNGDIFKGSFGLKPVTESYYETLKKFMEHLHRYRDKLEFSAISFEEFDYDSLNEQDLVYVDCPYLLTSIRYQGWTKEQELVLYAILDGLSKRNIRWVMSNIISIDGRVHQLLENWYKANNYRKHNVNAEYDKFQQNRTKANMPQEVIIFN